MIRVRFAPSPTGYIHIGNARTALFNHLFAKSQNGKFILRIEDTDAARSRDEYIDALYEDLRWLGIEWQEGPDVGGPFKPYRQTERTQIYRDFANKFIKEGHAYYCYCTEAELEFQRQEAQRRKLPPHYSNRCRTISAEETRKREAQGIKPVLRFKIENPQLAVDDLIRGRVEFNLDQMSGDFVIMKQDQTPTFHLAVCADDGLMQISHVIRGEDHLSNTPRHVLLFKAMGFKPPQFAHMSLTASPTGGLLSKREGATSIREYRENGFPASGVVNYLSLLGWSPEGENEIFSMQELIERYDIRHMKKAASIFDRAKLEWVAGMHMRKLTDEEFTERAFSYLNAGALVKPGAIEKDPAWYREAALLFKDNICNFRALKDRWAVFDDPVKIDEHTHLIDEKGRQVLHAASESLEGLPDVGRDFWQSWIEALKKKTTFKGKELFMPLRIAITGQTEGPELKSTVKLLGRERTLARLRQAEKIS